MQNVLLRGKVEVEIILANIFGKLLFSVTVQNMLYVWNKKSTFFLGGNFLAREKFFCGPFILLALQESERLAFLTEKRDKFCRFIKINFYK